MDTITILAGGRRHHRPTRTNWLSRRDVACRCFECRTPQLAVARLRRWIAANPAFATELRAAGYRPGIHRFSPRMVRVLKRYLL